MATTAMAAIAAPREMADVGLHAKVVSILQPYMNGATKVLILGAGQGALEHRLMDNTSLRPENIKAADINPRQYRGPHGVECRECDLNGPVPFETASFDWVIATEVIEHLHNPHNLIAEAARVLKPLGQLLLTTPNAESFAQRARFFLTGKLDYFSEGDYQGSGHLHPIFHWLLERWYRDRFKLETYDSYSFHLRIPGTAIRIPMPKSRLWAPVNAYVFRKR